MNRDNVLVIAKTAVNTLLSFNDRTRGKVVDGAFLGRHVFLFTLKERPLLLNGEFSTVDRTMEMSDLIAMFQMEQNHETTTTN